VKPDRLLIILTTGPEDRGSRATLAFAMGVSALISGVDATIYLTMGGTFWSRNGARRKVRIEGFEPLQTYVDQYMEGGGKLTVCSPCNDFYCSIAGEEPMLPGAELCGLAHIVDLAMGSSVVTF
jgi:predicted peroxiredoxin